MIIKQGSKYSFKLLVYGQVPTDDICDFIVAIQRPPNYQRKKIQIRAYSMIGWKQLGDIQWLR